MLTNVILHHVVRASAFILPPAVAVTWLVLGQDVAVGLVVGAALAVGDAAGMIFLIGRMLDPGAEGGVKKGAYALLLVLKLVVVAALLWMALNRYGVSGLGIIIGIAVGLAATVVGASRGSTSQAGQDAIREAEKNIRDSDE